MQFLYHCTGALRCSKMLYISENIFGVDAGFKVSRAFLVEICGSSSFPFPLSTSRKQLDLSSNISDLSKAINLFFKNDKYHPILVNISFSKTLARKVLRRRIFRYNWQNPKRNIWGLPLCKGHLSFLTALSLLKLVNWVGEVSETYFFG